mmetsp:Transcript_26823/g.72429  ORF Transcript_26823/g.72429 Transcript_26823/m.72429 type:complete len:225 (+) Transcript_26823:622-1296(+)
MVGGCSSFFLRRVSILPGLRFDCAGGKGRLTPASCACCMSRFASLGSMGRGAMLASSCTESGRRCTTTCGQGGGKRAEFGVLAGAVVAVLLGGGGKLVLGYVNKSVLGLVGKEVILKRRDGALVLGRVGKPALLWGGKVSAGCADTGAWLAVELVRESAGGVVGGERAGDWLEARKGVTAGANEVSPPAAAAAAAGSRKHSCCSWHLSSVSILIAAIRHIRLHI